MQHAMRHGLAVLRSHYPSIDVNRVAAGFAAGTEPHQAEDLMNSSAEAAAVVVDDCYAWEEAPGPADEPHP